MENVNENTVKQRDLESLSTGDLLAIIYEKDTIIDKLIKQNNWLTEQFKLLKHKLFSKSSEQVHSLQQTLFDEDDEALQQEPIESDDDDITITVPEHERKVSNRKDKNFDTSNLPEEVNYIDLSEEEKQCACGACMKKFGEETKEEVVFQPAKLKVIKHVRPKYACATCEIVKTAPAIELPILKSKASASLLAEVILNKYRYHLPFYRQRKMLKNYQIDIPDNTIAGWAMKSGELLDPLYDAFWKQLATVDVLQADETPVKLLKPEKKAYMWLYHCYLPGKRFVIFEFSLGRSASVVDKRLMDFSGKLQTDGYSGYNTQRKKANVITFGCWDHARRKFVDVIKACGNNKTGKAGQMVKMIAKLYEVESKIKHLPYDERKVIRQEESKPKLEAIHEFVNKINAPPDSLLGKAVTYCKNQWPELSRYVDHGDVEISNCWIENQVRPFAVGKRNWLFVGNEVSASRAALLYSLIQSCELNEVDPRAYLEHVLNQVHRMRRKEVDPMTLLPNTIDPLLLEKSSAV